MIFQNPTQAINPVKNTRSTLSEPFEVIRGFKGKKLENHLAQTLSVVELGEELLDSYPHELSGGQKQRINIARALAVNPDLIVADEPTSYLDATLKTAIIKLLNSLWEKFGLTLLTISHDLKIIASISDRIAVLYRGHLVEIADTRTILHDPLHPYTKILVNLKNKSLVDYQRDTMALETVGCPFFNHCSMAKDQCMNKKPYLQIAKRNHAVACPVVVKNN
jgi:oligopeptide/dipeptide ABC transporter ATP-binding protein